MINAKDGTTTYLTTEEFLHLAKTMQPEEFQGLVLGTLRQVSERVIIAELAANKAVTELKKVDGLEKKVQELELKFAAVEKLIEGLKDLSFPALLN